MVVPVEIGHAAYARPVLKFIVENFGRTTLLTFKERLFPDLSQDTLLLLAEDKVAQGKGNSSGKLFFADLRNVDDLEDVGIIANLSSAEIGPRGTLERAHNPRLPVAFGRGTQAVRTAF